MKKIIPVLLILLIAVGCSTEKSNEIETTESEETITVTGDGHLYQDWAEIPLFTDDGYLDFYFTYKVSEYGEDHSELACAYYWEISDMFYRFEYYDRNEETFTLKKSLFGMDDGIKYDDMFQTRSYDMSVVKDESYWVDYDDNGEVIGVSLNVMEYGNHAPYMLSSFYSVSDASLECDRNDLSDEYPDGGKEAIETFLVSFEKEIIDPEQLQKDFETDLYFHDVNSELGIDCYIGPESLQMVLTSIDKDEKGTYVKGFLASGNDCKLYIDEENRVIEFVKGSYTTTYEYLEDYVLATYKKGSEEIIYKYDYERNSIME